MFVITSEKLATVVSLYKGMILILTLVLINPAPVHSNDTTARVGVGGITLTRNDDIRLLQEILEISTKSVRVQYLFVNESDHDIRSTVAFPMPLYGWNNGESSIDANERPVGSFKVWINGEPAKVKKSQKAMRGNLDITDALRKIGLSDKQIFETFGDCDVDHGCGIVEEKMLQVSKLFPGDQYFPQWKVAETLYWEQLFPKKEIIVVGHQYAPFVGYVYNYPGEKKWFANGFLPAPSDRYQDGKDIREACIDESVTKAVFNKIKARDDGGTSGTSTPEIYLQDVEYILGTGANWKGGKIMDFKLRIIKDSADQVISVCFPGRPSTVTPTVVEFHQQDYLPQEKLIVYFINVLKR